MEFRKPEEYWEQATKMTLSRIDRESSSVDRALFYVNTGSLVLSAGFVADLAKEREVVMLWLIYTGWILIVASLIVMLGNSWLSMQRNVKFFAKLEAWKANHFIPPSFSGGMPHDKWIKGFNFTAGGLTIVGIAFLLFFTMYNVSQFQSDDRPQPQPGTFSDPLRKSPMPIEPGYGDPAPAPSKQPNESRERSS